MSADATQWTPPSGRHQVSMGGSMTRFLKQRKGIQVKQNKGMPTSNYFYFRNKFMPESVDNTRPGSVEVIQQKNGTDVRAERACYASEDVHVFHGKEEPAKEVECVLIYDEETRMFTLEKLDSSLNLNYGGKAPSKVRPPSASPLPTPSPATSTSKIEEEEDLLTAELDRELLTTLDEVSAPAPTTTAKRKPIAPVKAQPVETANVKPKSRLRGAAGGGQGKGKAAAPKVAPTSFPVLPSALPSKLPAEPAKAKASSMDVFEEVLDYDLPAHKTAVDDVSDTGGLAFPTPGGVVALAPPPLQDEEEDGEDWDKVAGEISATTPNVVTAGEDASIFGEVDADEDGEEINVDQFAELMNQELLGEEDGDGDMEDIFGDAADANGGYDGLNRGLKPMSLNQFAGGALVDDDDDDSTSSDESDDD